MDGDVRPERGHLGRGRGVGVQVALEQPHAADVQRDHGPGGGAVAVDELGRAAPDVDHQRAPVASKPGGGAAVGRGRLGLAAQDLGLHAEQLTHAVEEHLAVGRVPGRAGRHQPPPLHPEPPADLGVARQHLQRAVKRGRVEAPAAVDPLPEPDDARDLRRGALAGTPVLGVDRPVPDRHPSEAADPQVPRPRRPLRGVRRRRQRDAGVAVVLREALHRAVTESPDRGTIRRWRSSSDGSR